MPVPRARIVHGFHPLLPNLPAGPKIAQQLPQGKPSPRPALGNEGNVGSTGAAAQKLPTAQGRSVLPKPAAVPQPQKLTLNSDRLVDLALELAERKASALKAQQKEQKAGKPGLSSSRIAGKEVKRKSWTAAAGPVVQKGNEENQAVLANRKTPPQKKGSSVIDLTCPDSLSSELRYTHTIDLHTLYQVLYFLSAVLVITA